ncbi:MAG: hypothetical protein AAF160_01955 [Pseudomonadota bacterium]
MPAFNPYAALAEIRRFGPAEVAEPAEAQANQRVKPAEVLRKFAEAAERVGSDRTRKHELPQTSARLPQPQPVESKQLPRLPQVPQLQTCEIESRSLPCEAAIDAFEERAALREIDGGETRVQVEERAAAELGQPATELLNRPGEPSEENDPEVLLAFLRARRPATYGAAATDLGWGATRAWRAMSSLKRQGRVRLDSLREAVPIKSDALVGATRDE